MKQGRGSSQGLSYLPPALTIYGSFHGARKEAGIHITYRKFLTDRHLISPSHVVAFFFQRAVAIVDVMGHVGRVVAELNSEVQATGVLQLAVLTLAGTNRSKQLLRLTH